MTAEELLALRQGTDEWRDARIGYAGASDFASILAKGQGKMRGAYLRKLVCERLTGKSSVSYSNGHMERGMEQEPYARMAYEARTGRIVQEVGIIRHTSLMASCSPDGLIDDEGGVEIKSVIPTVHLETIQSGGYPSEHRAQIMGSLWLSGRAFWEFCSYSPDMPKHLQTYICRVARDEEYIANVAAEVEKFLGEVDAAVQSLMERAA